MARDRQMIGQCPQCGPGILRCSYNLFEKGPLTIHSWEHRCDDCGLRLTEAFRSDQTAPDAASDPMVCPFCGRQAIA